MELLVDHREFLEAFKFFNRDSSNSRGDIPMFSGKMDAEEVIDWIEELNNYFEYQEVPED